LILLKKSSWICVIFTHSSLLFSFSTAKHQVNTFIYHTSKMIHWKLTYMVGVMIKCCWTEESGIIDCSLWKKFNEISIIYSKVIILISFTTNLTQSLKSDSFRSSTCLTSLILLKSANDKIWVVCVSHLMNLRIIHSKKIRLIQCFQTCCFIQ
jgi:hypothetical protein